MNPDQNRAVAAYLGELVEQLAATPVEPADRAIVRQHLLDSIAAGLIGSGSGIYRDLLRTCGRPGATEGGHNPLDAAMLWAFAINGSVFEDGSKEGACHPAAAVMPVVFAFGQGKNWELIDRAVIAGYDVMVRLARGGNPQLTLKGFHPTAIFAPFGAAATLAVLQGFTPQQTLHALSLAAQGSGGLMAAFKCGPTQPLQVAWSVRNGVCAALLAAAGHAGYTGILDEGFYPAYLGQPLVSAVDAPLGRGLAIRGSYLKPYPGCRHLHPALDALAAILEKAPLTAAQVERITVGTYRAAVDTEIHQLKSRGDAYFNLSYAMAARIVLGHNDYDAFAEEHFTNPRIVALMPRIRVAVEPQIDALYPKKRGALVELQTAAGGGLRKEVLIARGEPENPLPGAFTRHKFRKAAADCLTEGEQAEIEAVLADDCSLDTSALFTGITRILTNTQGSKHAA